MGHAKQPERRKVVTVIGSGDSLSEDQRKHPRAVGAWIAAQGFHLLTGGGAGVMEAASEGFCSVERAGLAIGVIPQGKPPEHYPNRWIELPVYTHLSGINPLGPDSRNPINVRSCHALVAFPGRSGTEAELRLALEWPRLQGALIACLRDSERIGSLDVEALLRLNVPVAADADAVIAYLERNPRLRPAPGDTEGASAAS